MLIQTVLLMSINYKMKMKCSKLFVRIYRAASEKKPPARTHTNDSTFPRHFPFFVVQLFILLEY